MNPLHRNALIVCIFLVIALLSFSFLAHGSSATMKVFGTEYKPNMTAKPFLQLLDDNSQPMDNASCFISVFYPNTTVLISEAMMSKLSGYGFYYYDFNVPETLGVYMVSARCQFNTSLSEAKASSFGNVSAQNIYGDYSMTWDDDGVFHQYTGANSNLNVSYKFNGIETNNLTSLEIYWNGKGASSASFRFYVWNYNTSSWVLLPNSAIGNGIATSSAFVSASNVISVNPSYYIQNGTVNITIYSAGNNAIQTDKVAIMAIGRVSPYLDSLRGSGEVHVSSDANVTILPVAFDKPKIDFQGTEYEIGQTAKAWLQVLDANNMYVDNATCFISIDYPDGTPYVADVLATHQNKGIYFYDFEVPSVQGIYPETAFCYYNTSTSTTTASSGATIVGNEQFFTSWTYTQTNDNTYYDVHETGTPRRVTEEFNFTVSEPELSTTFSITSYIRWDGASNDRVYFYIYNWSSAKWLELPNYISNTGGSKQLFSNSITIINNATAMGLVNSTNNRVRVRLNDTTVTDSSTSSLDIDYLAIQFNYLSGEKVIEVKGASEMHVVIPSNLPYELISNCGSQFDIGFGSEIANCGLLIPQAESIMDYPEGEIWDNLTIISFSTKETYWSYETPQDIVCDAIVGINQTNSSFGNGTELDSSTFILSSGDKNNCRISVPISLTLGETYYYTIYMDNYLLYQTEISYEREYENIDNFTKSLCYPLASLLNYTFETPTTGLNRRTNNTALFTCEQQLENLYWASTYLNSSHEATDLSELSSYLIDLKFTMVDVEMYHNLLNNYDLTRKIQLPYVMTTLCGSSSDIKNLLDMSQCAVLLPQNQSYYNYPEGDLLDYINITATYSQNTFWNYETPEAISCDSIYFVQRWNGTAWNNVSTTGIIFSVGNMNNCRISVPINLTKDQTYQFKIQMDNLLIYNLRLLFENKWRFLDNWTKELCNPIAVNASYTFQTPLQQIAPRTNNTILRTCEQALDNLWWWDNYYNLTLLATNTLGIVKYYDDIITIDVPSGMNYFNLLNNYDITQKMSNVSVTVNQTDVFVHISS